MSGDKKQSEESDHINLTVQGPNNYGIIQFKIKKHAPMRKLMNAYCERAGLDINAVKFHYDEKPINELSTPLTLEMEEGDIIDVYQKQEGGL